MLADKLSVVLVRTKVHVFSCCEWRSLFCCRTTPACPVLLADFFLSGWYENFVNNISKPTDMQYLSDNLPVQGKSIKKEVYIRVWEVFLSHNKNNLATTLETYSLNPPIQDLNYEGTITFCFTPFDWNRTLKNLLQQNNVPFIEEQVGEKVASEI